MKRPRYSADHLLGMLGSCVDCGVLVLVRNIRGVPPELFDVSVPTRPTVGELVGFDAEWGQGFGVTNGGPHRCPPLDFFGAAVDLTWEDADAEAIA